MSIGDLQSLLDEIDSAGSLAELGERAIAAIAPLRLTAAASGIITGSRNARVKVGAVSRTHLAAKVVGLGLVAL